MSIESSAEIKALTFDVFGTVVDWRSSIIGELSRFGEEYALTADWAGIADRWRIEGYIGGIKLVSEQSLPFQTADQLHLRMLEILLHELDFPVENNTEAVRHLNQAWHRLHPWPDSSTGLDRLKTNFVISTLSNGNVALLTNMAKFAELPWDVILSAEIVGSFKPTPDCYRNAAKLLDLKPEQILMVAAHEGDLKAAQAIGFKTAYVFRPDEMGPDGGKNFDPDLPYDYVTHDFHELATALGCA